MPQHKLEATWSLFSGSFPGFRVPNRTISHDTFRAVLEKSTRGDRKTIRVDAGTALYLSSPFSDCKLVSREVDLEIVKECFGKFLKANGKVAKVLWKAHPVSPLEESEAFAGEVAEALGVEIEVFRDNINLEELFFALSSEGEVPVFATTSSSLYVAEVLSKKKKTQGVEREKRHPSCRDATGVADLRHVRPDRNQHH